MKVGWHCVAQARGIPLVYILLRNIFLCKSSIIILTYSLYCNNWRNHSSLICYLKKIIPFYRCNDDIRNLGFRRIEHDFSDLNDSLLNSLNSCKSSVCAFVPFPKQGLEMEAVVLHRVGFLAYFCPKQGQDFKPSAAPLYPNLGQVPPPPGGYI